MEEKTAHGEGLNQFLPDHLTYGRLCAKHFVCIGQGKNKDITMRNTWVN